MIGDKRSRERRNALAGSGPIADRARSALRTVATQFGTATASDPTSVTVRTRDGIVLRLSYDLGNYIFSRVYNLTITTTLPEESRLPTGLTLNHRDRSGARYVSKQAPNAAPSDALAQLNRDVQDRLSGIDLLSSEVGGPARARTLSLTPMGGSYVWVLIPPVFKATAFPAGEPQRILDLIRTMREWSPAAAPTPPAH